MLTVRVQRDLRRMHDLTRIYEEVFHIMEINVIHQELYTSYTHIGHERTKMFMDLIKSMNNQFAIAGFIIFLYELI